VVISGSGFTGATQVRFGAIPASSFTVVSDNEIDAVSPAQAPSKRNVVVSTPGGNSPAVSADQFLYPSLVTPAITSISPSSGPTSGGTMVTINGSGFTGVINVRVGGVPVTSFTFVSDSQITAVVAAGKAGNHDIIVSTPGAGVNPATPADIFTDVAPPAAISGLSQGSGPAIGGTPVTISGTGFTAATQVKFGAVPASSFTVVSDSQIDAVSPAQAANVRHVQVVSPGGNSPFVNVDLYTYTSSIDAISPSGGPTTGGTVVVISGSGFTNATRVRFGSLPATSFNIVSDNEIDALAPPRAAGVYDIVVNTSGGGTSPLGGADQFLYSR
jgi:hypothetical protein